MSTSEMKSRVVNEKVLVLERIFHAPQDLVFQMFKEADHLKHWWGPAGWELPVCHVDFRNGGSWHYCMKCVDRNQGDFYGMESWGKVIYKKIIEPETIIYTDYFSDAEGTIDETMPSSEITLEFIDIGNGQTKLVNHAEYVSAEALQKVMDMGMLQGITETWDRLEERLNY
ncbi:SRPBCC domain-containing protein [Gracilibacillus caseinilyticus]|uniref:SRPBCC domain-containing protein n=1 Tax=Gracilibacillus caseinilyticus TaxID=2932256 RepID=A0ABY4ES39_9BACI|nr:SRPBCC domain-containing protein [Gracilibacillus caseinilyticus]UOQ46707.1 SRPBCC domain-containing protein [Gracilibacillus caseinilyticus]